MLTALTFLASASLYASTQAVVMAQQKFTSARLCSHYSSIIRNTHDNLCVRQSPFVWSGNEEKVRGSSKGSTVEYTQSYQD